MSGHGKKRRLWSVENMKEAYNAVVEDNVSISAAAWRFGVPRMTLSDRIRGKIQLGAKLGKQTALTTADETTLENYIKYMHSQRFHLTRLQVMKFAWAIDHTQEESTRIFSGSGPSRKWWRGFKTRHQDLALRHAETIDRGRVANARPEVIQDYFEQLGKIISENGLENKPSQIYNCDEAAIHLDRNAHKVIVPRNSRHAHTLAHCTTEHISVLCTIRADGGFIPPLIVFAKGMPSLRGFEKQGPANASNASTDSGFVNQEVYASWFEKTFIPNLPPQRPVLLIQDGATAHISPQLIELAIKNEIILLCLPAKLTHILQPCDVTLFRKMKNETAIAMTQLTMTRGDHWVSKGRFPSVFKVIFENSMLPATITEGFRKCGIVPLNPKAVEQEFVCPATETSLEEMMGEETPSNTQKTPPTGDISTVEIAVEVITDMPPDAEVITLEDSSQSGKTCPPSLALQAVESALTPRKKTLYQKRYSTGIRVIDDPVYTTWRNLKEHVSGQPQPEPTQENPLVRAGVISKQLQDIFPSPTHESKHQKKDTVRIKHSGARVLTSQEISDQILAQDKLKQETKVQKIERQLLREKKQLAKEVLKRRKGQERAQKKTNATRKSSNKAKGKNGNTKCPSAKDCDVASYLLPMAVNIPDARQRYFHHLQATLLACPSWEGISQVIPDELPYVLDVNPTPIASLLQQDTDVISKRLLCGDVETKHLQPIRIYGDGNCLPRTVSMYLSGEQNMHVEIRAWHLCSNMPARWGQQPFHPMICIYAFNVCNMLAFAEGRQPRSNGWCLIWSCASADRGGSWYKHQWTPLCESRWSL